MVERKTTAYSFSRRLGYTHYDVDVTCDPDAKATYEDRLLEPIRSLPRRISTHRKKYMKNSRPPGAKVSAYSLIQAMIAGHNEH